MCMYVEWRERSSGEFIILWKSCGSCIFQGTKMTNVLFKVSSGITEYTHTYYNILWYTCEKYTLVRTAKVVRFSPDPPLNPSQHPDTGNIICIHPRMYVAHTLELSRLKTVNSSCIISRAPCRRPAHQLTSLSTCLQCGGARDGQIVCAGSASGTRGGARDTHKIGWFYLFFVIFLHHPDAANLFQAVHIHTCLHRPPVRPISGYTVRKSSDDFYLVYVILYSTIYGRRRKTNVWKWKRFKRDFAYTYM